MAREPKSAVKVTDSPTSPHTVAHPPTPERGGMFVKGGPGGPGRPAIISEIRELARKNAMHAFERLLTLVDSGPPAVQIQAAKVVLGAAGVPLAAPSTVRIRDERPQLPPVALADLLAAVRESRRLDAKTVEVVEVPRLTSGDAPDGQKGEP